MTFDPNDPRLTAYVLDETDPVERLEIEAMLADSPEGRQAVEEIRRTVGWLTEQLREEQALHAVTAESNHRPPALFASAPAAPERPWWRSALARLGGLAALLLIGFTVLVVPGLVKPLAENRQAAPAVAMDRKARELLAPASPAAAKDPAPLELLEDRLEAAGSD